MRKLANRFAVLVATFLLLMALSAVAFGEGEDYTAQAAQKAHNYREITVSLPGLDTLGDAVDTVAVTADMYYKGNVVRSSSEEKKLSDIDATEKSFDFEVSDFGRWNVTIQFKKGDTVVDEEDCTIGVVADNYNIANLSATTPGLIFSLKAVGGAISVDANGDPIPSFLTVDRKTSFNWGNLPENIFACPFAKDNNSYGENVAAVGDYIKALYKLNNSSHFYLYCNDTTPQLEIISYIWAEDGLPDSSYSVRLITDGAASYAFFRSEFDGMDNAEAKFNEMVKELKSVKKRMLNGESVNLYELKYGHLGYYAYPLLDVESDAQWWVVRKSKGDTFKIQDDAFATKLVNDGRVTSNYINNLLAAVDSAGKSAEFKQLYKFDDSAFEATRGRNKKIMMILGTATSAEVDLNSYVRLTEAYYGDGYEYYYKGHPGYLPELIPEMKKNLDEMKLQILDSSIAAELFVFYDPDICMSGYPSSTFQGVGTEETDCGLYNVTKTAAQTQDGVRDYKDQIEFFASKLGADADESILSMIRNKDNANFLVELNDTSKYDFAIYDDTAQILYFCKDGSVVEERAVPDISLPDDGSGDGSGDGGSNGPAAEATAISEATVTGIKARNFTGKAITQNPVVKLGDKTLASGTDYEIAYSNNVNVGKATLTITGKGNYTGSLKKTFNIKPKGTSLAKLSAARKAVKVKWKKQSLKMKKARITGYQIQVATNKTFTKNKKTVTVTGYSKVSKKVSGLKGGKKYYVRVRTFKKISGAKYYSSWSKVKTIKTKK